MSQDRNDIDFDRTEKNLEALCLKRKAIEDRQRKKKEVKLEERSYTNEAKHAKYSH